MKEETACLLLGGIAHLIPVSTSPVLPPLEDVARHTAERIERIKKEEERAQLNIAKKSMMGKEVHDVNGEKARAKREARAAARADKDKKLKESQGLFGEEPTVDTTTTTTLSSSSSQPAQTSQSSPQSISKNGSSRHPDIPESHSLGHFHTIRPLPSFPHFVLSTPITSLPHPLFPFPQTTRDHALVGTFQTLSSLGYRMGLGPRFGGEYLIYPGDYLRYHAHFTSQVLVRDEDIRPAEIVAWGRLGTGTKKAGLLCCWDDGKREQDSDLDPKSSHAEHGHVEFYSLEWANFG